jgi:acetyl-CoA acetyltransferase
MTHSNTYDPQVFKDNAGTVTVGNASSISYLLAIISFPSLVDYFCLFMWCLSVCFTWSSDDAATLVLVSGQEAEELGLQALARIKGFADVAQVSHNTNSYKQVYIII